MYNCTCASYVSWPVFKATATPTSALFHLPADLASTLFDQFKAFPPTPPGKHTLSLDSRVWQTLFQDFSILLTKFFGFRKIQQILGEHESYSPVVVSSFQVLREWMICVADIFAGHIGNHVLKSTQCYEYSRCKLICQRYKGNYKQIHNSYMSHTYLPDTSKLLPRCK